MKTFSWINNQMSIIKHTAAPLPIEAVEATTHERMFYVETKLVGPLVKDINESIAKARDSGLTSVKAYVPSFIYGFPLPDVAYLKKALAERYEKAGYRVTLLQKEDSLEVAWQARPRSSKGGS